VGKVNVKIGEYSFLTTASCPKKDFYRRQKRTARKAEKKFIPEPVLMLS
jgi:hypothetical protein